MGAIDGETWGRLVRLGLFVLLVVVVVRLRLWRPVSRWLQSRG
jgi:hypothetical protein